MPSTTCVNCRAEIAAGARFCRQCGQPSATAGGTSVTEATTRFLETPTKTAGGAGPATYTTAEPSELSPADTRSVHAAATTTQSLASPKRQRTLLLLPLSLSAVLLVAFAALLALWYSLKSAGVPPPPAVTVSHPPALPALPAPPIGGLNQPGANPLAYPNATVVQNIVRVGKPVMVRMSSPDSFEKIVAWYEAKLRPTEKVITPGANAILKAGETTVIITTGAPNQTSIMLTQPAND